MKETIILKQLNGSLFMDYETGFIYERKDNGAVATTGMKSELSYKDKMKDKVLKAKKTLNKKK